VLYPIYNGREHVHPFGLVICIICIQVSSILVQVAKGTKKCLRCHKDMCIICMVVFRVLVRISRSPHVEANLSVVCLRNVLQFYKIQAVLMHAPQMPLVIAQASTSG
jgi:hypothetical protein